MRNCQLGEADHHVQAEWGLFMAGPGLNAVAGSMRASLQVFCIAQTWPWRSRSEICCLQALPLKA